MDNNICLLSANQGILKYPLVFLVNLLPFGNLQMVTIFIDKDTKDFLKAHQSIMLMRLAKLLRTHKKIFKIIFSS